MVLCMLVDACIKASAMRHTHWHLQPLVAVLAEPRWDGNQRGLLFRWRRCSRAGLCWGRSRRRDGGRHGCWCGRTLGRRAVLRVCCLACSVVLSGMAHACLLPSTGQNSTSRFHRSSSILEAHLTVQSGRALCGPALVRLVAGLQRCCCIKRLLCGLILLQIEAGHSAQGWLKSENTKCVHRGVHKQLACRC
jgi:hypothetical protein